EVRAACEGIGFFTITGHGVETRIIDDLRTAAKDFFARPAHEKAMVHHGDPSLPRGYRAIGDEGLAYGAGEETPPDLKEVFHMGPPDFPNEDYFTCAAAAAHFIKNVYPEEPPDFRAIYPRMCERGSGVIVNVIGMAGERPRAGYIAGSMGNAALMQLTRALGAESLDHGVRVVGINPGPIETERLVSQAKINEVRAACEGIGFFTITGHGVETRIIDDLRTAAKDFFARPAHEKAMVHHGDPSLPRGYRAIGDEGLAYGAGEETPPDLKEVFHMGPPDFPNEDYFTCAAAAAHFIKNVYPEEPPDFRA
ncbi:2-oxoglutarate-dependent dioxygenase (Ascochitine biosynthesis cluster protein 3), partial [Durusdinium trenchii]